MRIFVTGIGGFLGGRLAAHWRSQGHVLSGCSSNINGPGIVHHRLGDPPPIAALAGHDVVIHCAYDFSTDAALRNVAGTRAMFVAAESAGVKRQLYMSSYSARLSSPSRYGAAKFAIEQDILARGGDVVRPGLVAGPGGMFAKLARDLARRNVVPLVYPDTKTVAVIGLPDLLAACSAILETTSRGAWNLFAAPLISSREFVEAVWRGQARSGRVIAIAPWLAAGALRILDLIRVSSPTSLDSLRSQLANQTPVHQSHLNLLVPAPNVGGAAVEEGARQCL